MQDTIRRLLIPPTFEDDEKTRLAGLLHNILLITLGLNIVNMLLAVIAAPYATWSLGINLVLLGIQIGLLVLLWRGYVRSGSLAFCIVGWLCVTAVIYSGGGIP